MHIYKHILVKIDCPPLDEAILDHVYALAVQNNAKEKNNEILRAALHAIRGAGVEDRNIRPTISPSNRAGVRVTFALTNRSTSK